MAAPGEKSVVKGMVKKDIKLDGKNVIITGANSGIGYETALDMLQRGARVIMACRNVQKAEEAKSKLLEEVKDAQVLVKKLDLASLESVREFAKDINETESRLDILINNAGIMLCPPGKTKEGFEIQFGVNHIGHFLLTNLLLDLIKKSAPSRIVIVSSAAHGFSGIMWDNIMQESQYNSLKAYGQSKTANILHCLELSKKLEGTGVTCYSLYPGAIKTNLQQHLGNLDHLPFFSRMFVKTWNPLISIAGSTPVQGAQTTIYCAIAPELANTSGKYYSNCSQATPSKHARRAEDAEKLWKLTEELIEKVESSTEEHGSADAPETEQNKVDSASQEQNEKDEISSQRSDIAQAQSEQTATSQDHNNVASASPESNKEVKTSSEQDEAAPASQEQNETGASPEPNVALDADKEIPKEEQKAIEKDVEETAAGDSKPAAPESSKDE